MAADGSSPTDLPIGVAMQMIERSFVCALIFLVALLGACAPAARRTNPNDYVGEYISNPTSRRDRSPASWFSGRTERRWNSGTTN